MLSPLQDPSLAPEQLPALPRALPALLGPVSMKSLALQLLSRSTILPTPAIKSYKLSNARHSSLGSDPCLSQFINQHNYNITPASLYPWREQLGKLLSLGTLVWEVGRGFCPSAPAPLWMYLGGWEGRRAVEKRQWRRAVEPIPQTGQSPVWRRRGKHCPAAPLPSQTRLEGEDTSGLSKE